MTKKIPYPFYHICKDCGDKYGGSSSRRLVSLWRDLCPVCGRMKQCGQAGHDFGVFEINSSLIKKENLFKYKRSNNNERS